MYKTNRSFKEDRRPLLYLSQDGENLGRYPPPVCEMAVSKGAVNYMGRWPSHVFAAFVAGCLVLAIFAFFAVVAAIFSKIPSSDLCREEWFTVIWPLIAYRSVGLQGPTDRPSIDNIFFRRLRNIENNGSTNVYFVKHENRTWSEKELCYIETAARKHPELTVYLINLLIGEHQKEGATTKPMIQMIETKDKMRASSESLDLLEGMNDISNNSSEGKLRKELATNNLNVKNIDVTVENFFAGSRLSGVCKSLNRRMVEIAARAYVLWNFPGVALDPYMYSSLNQTREFLCKDGSETCKPEQVATVELKGDLQASAVPCQAFVGYLIREIATNDLPDQEYTLKQALNEFCPRSQRCPEVKVISLESSEEDKNLSCPTISRNRLPTELN